MSNVNEVNESTEVLEINPIESTAIESIESTEEFPIQSNYVLFDELKSKFTENIPVNEILEIKSYLPLMYKQLAIDNILSASKEYMDNGMTKINYISLELWKSIKIVEFYTNYAVDPETMIEEYDYMEENNIIEKIYDEIGLFEISRISQLLQNELDQMVKIDNSIELIVDKHMTELEYIVSDNLDLFQSKLEVLINKVPDMTEGKMEYYLNEAKETLKSFSPKAYKTLNKVMKFAEGKDVK